MEIQEKIEQGYASWDGQQIRGTLFRIDWRSGVLSRYHQPGVFDFCHSRGVFPVFPKILVDLELR